VAKYETFLLQNSKEFEIFRKMAQRNNVRSYLEIGSKMGGSLWRMANSLPVGSRVVSVDLPHGDRSFKESAPHLKACIDHLRMRGYDPYLFLTDSTDEDTVEAVRELGPFDLCLIDANHTEPYVRKDFANYGPMSKIIAFHDISFVPEPNRDSKKLPIDVPKVWRELKEKHPEYSYAEICHHKNENGIGVLWRDPSSRL